MFKIFFLSIFILFLTPSTYSANSPNSYELPFEVMDTECLRRYGAGKEDLIINSPEELQEVIYASGAKDEILACWNNQWPRVDFSMKTILGAIIGVGGCTHEFDRKIIRDDDKKEIVYQITSTETGTCQQMMRDCHWLIIPKVPKGYTFRTEPNVIYKPE